MLYVMLGLRDGFMQLWENSAEITVFRSINYRRLQR